MKKLKDINKMTLLIMIIAFSAFIGLAFKVYAVTEKKDTVNGDRLITKTDLETAYTSGKEVWVSGNDMMKSSGGFMYCINHVDTDNMSGPRMVFTKISITGNTAKNIKNGKSESHKLNGMLAYVIALDNSSLPTGYKEENGSVRQKTIWRIMADLNTEYIKDSNGNVIYQGSWLRKVYDKIKNDNDPTWNCGVGKKVGDEADKANKLYADAIAYANKINNNDNFVAQITNVVGEGMVTSNTFAGPFTVNFKGNLDNYHVYSNTEDVTSKVKIVDSNHNAITTIKSGTEFYIENTSGKKISSIKINVKSKEKTYSADIYVLGQRNDKSQQVQMGVVPNSSYKEATKTINFKTYLDIEIEKVDKDNQATKLQGVKFNFIHASKYAKTVVVENGYSKITEWTTNESEAYKFETGADGIIKIRLQDASNGYEFQLKEVEAKDKYEKKIEFVSSSGLNASPIIDSSKTIITCKVQSNSNGKIQLVISNEKKKNLDLEIVKVDRENNGIKLQGVKFVFIHDSKYVKTVVSEDGYNKVTEWTTSESEAKQFETGTDGIIKIRVEDVGDQEYVFQLKEVSAKALYEENIEYVSSKGLAVTPTLDGTQTIITCKKQSDSDGKVQLVISNQRKKISISGYVWLENPGTKANEYNEKYDTSEKRVAGVKVRLVHNTNGEVLATASTDSKGEYRFEEVVLESQVKNYHIEFDYGQSNSSTLESNKKYIPVVFNSTNKNEIVANGSRALVDSVVVKDSDTPSKAFTDKKENGYGLNYFLDSSLYKDGELSNINLGLKELLPTAYSLHEDVLDVKINVKGYTYTYLYGEFGNSNFENAPKVKWQNRDLTGYSRSIYPSDIAYAELDKDEEDRLNVNVRYGIYVKNDTETNIENLYMEKSLKLTELVNNFDSSRYELNDDNWKETANGVAEYKNISTFPEVEKSKTVSTTITFKVNLDELKNILNSDGIIEKHPTQAVSKAYHNYTRKDYSWNDGMGVVKPHTTSESPAEADAPYLIFKLGDNRNITGKVFEDGKVSTNGEVLGNGIVDNGENAVENVKVQLMDIGLNKQSHLYVTDGIKSIENAAVTETNREGIFTLNGVVPGEYYLKFTYPDGSTKIVGRDNVDFKEYKSTIIDSSVKGAFENVQSAQKRIWYRNLNNSNYSVAKDILKERADYNNGKASAVSADSPYFSILVENTGNTEGKVEKSENIYNGFNFGIIKAPESKIEIEKVISRIELTNVQGNRPIAGNPANPGNDSMTGVSNLGDPNIKYGSTYVRVELPETEIYGSDLKIEYTIRAINKSEINYYGENYYWYGTDKNNLVGINVQEIQDCLDNKLNFVSANVKTDLGEEEIDSVKQQIIKMSDINKTIYPNSVKPNESFVDVKLSAFRKLSRDEEMSYINKARVSKAENAGSSDELYKSIIRKIVVPADWASAQAIGNAGIGSAELTITPPTGADKNKIIIYSVIGIVSLITIAGGIIIIKKKVI